jgi:hypothetical protein
MHGAGSAVRPGRLMRLTLTIRLTPQLAAWLEQASKRSGKPRSSVVLQVLEKARDGYARPSFMRLAGIIRGAHDLSQRKGFSLP